MLRRILDIITVTVGIILLIVWLIDAMPVYKTTASVLNSPDSYTHNGIK